MWTALGRAPCSYSSASRTSRTTVAGSAAMAASAAAVSTSRIDDLAWASRSRKVGMVGDPHEEASGADSRNPAAQVDIPVPGSALHQRGEHIADRLADHGIGDAVVRGGLGVDDDDSGTGPGGHVDQVAGRGHGE